MFVGLFFIWPGGRARPTPGDWTSIWPSHIVDKDLGGPLLPSRCLSRELELEVAQLGLEPELIWAEV